MHGLFQHRVRHPFCRYGGGKVKPVAAIFGPRLDLRNMQATSAFVRSPAMR
jgi:hypothetical protein